MTILTVRNSQHDILLQRQAMKRLMYTLSASLCLFAITQFLLALLSVNINEFIIMLPHDTSGQPTHGEAALKMGLRDWGWC